MFRSPAMLLPHESTVSHEHHLEHQDSRRGVGFDGHVEVERVCYETAGSIILGFTFRLQMDKNLHIHMIWMTMI